jgi:hypothetical protein
MEIAGSGACCTHAIEIASLAHAHAPAIAASPRLVAAAAMTTAACASSRTDRARSPSSCARLAAVVRWCCRSDRVTSCYTRTHVNASSTRSRSHCVRDAAQHSVRIEASSAQHRANEIGILRHLRATTTRHRCTRVVIMRACVGALISILRSTMFGSSPAANNIACAWLAITH